MAQTGSRVYEACEPDRGRIDATVLPEVVDQDLCPVAGRTIVDHGAGTVVPEPGESVFTEAMSPEGNQQLVVINPPGDRLLLREVGSEGAQEDSKTLATRAGSPAACSDPHYYSWGMRLNHYIRWYFNAKSTPRHVEARSSRSDDAGRHQRQCGARCVRRPRRRTRRRGRRNDEGVGKHGNRRRSVRPTTTRAWLASAICRAIAPETRACGPGSKTGLTGSTPRRSGPTSSTTPGRSG